MFKVFVQADARERRSRAELQLTIVLRRPVIGNDDYEVRGLQVATCGFLVFSFNSSDRSFCWA